MPPIEVGPVRAISAIDSRHARKTGSPQEQPVKPERSARPAPDTPAVVKSDALDPGKAPVDAERVQLIRKAIENDAYPVVPAKIADAMIAAGLLLRSGKA